MDDQVKLLSPPTNYAVVHLPGRRFPGVVFQGDTLHILESKLKRLFMTNDELTSEVLRDELDEILEQIRDAKLHYEAVCKQNNISLPYPV